MFQQSTIISTFDNGVDSFNLIHFESQLDTFCESEHYFLTMSHLTKPKVTNFPIRNPFI